MLYLRSFNRFVLISLTFLGVSISSMSAAQAAVYKLQFNTFSLGSIGSSYFSNPAGHSIVLPDTHLVDIFFEASPGSGVIIDDPNRFHAIFNSHDPNVGKITQVNLYNYGVSPHTYNPYAAAVPRDYAGDIIDAFTPRDGQVDAVLLDIPSLLAPDPRSSPDPVTGLPHPGEPLFSYSLRGDMTPTPNADRLIFNGQSHQGNWAISEVSAVPIPAAVWLFGTGLLGLIGFSKRRKAA